MVWPTSFDGKELRRAWYPGEDPAAPGKRAGRGRLERRDALPFCVRFCKEDTGERSSGEDAGAGAGAPGGRGLARNEMLEEIGDKSKQLVSQASGIRHQEKHL